jgi:hypothetical protein
MRAGTAAASGAHRAAGVCLSDVHVVDGSRAGCYEVRGLPALISQKELYNRITVKGCCFAVLFCAELRHDESRSADFLDLRHASRRASPL